VFASDLRLAVSRSSRDGELARSGPDIRYEVASRARTSVVAWAVGSGADVDAPTIITVDSGAPVSTAPQPARVSIPFSVATPTTDDEQTRVPGGFGPQPAHAGALTPAGGPLDMASSVTIPQSPKPFHPLDTSAKSSRGNSFALAGAGALILILAVIGVGGFFAVKWLTAKPNEDVKGEVAGNRAGSDAGGSAAATSLKEAGRYWLELLPESIIGKTTRAAGSLPLNSGQSFKFHFVFNEDGYLYIVCPGDGNRPTAFLTSKPASISGLKDNRVVKGADFSFPSGIEHWLALDTKPGTEEYTILLSPSPLSSPEFLTKQAGRVLTDEDFSEFRTFLGQQSVENITTELNDTRGDEPFVIVKIPAQSSADKLVRFIIKIQHK
jgi:hypothetical protein